MAGKMHAMKRRSGYRIVRDPHVHASMGSHYPHVHASMGSHYLHVRSHGLQVLARGGARLVRDVQADVDGLHWAHNQYTIPYHTMQLKCTKGKPRHYKLGDSRRANFATINMQQAKAELCAACPACELALRSRKSFRVARTPQVATRCRLVPPTCGSGDCAALPPWSLCGVAPAGPTPWKMTPCGSSSEPREPARNGRMRS